MDEYRADPRANYSHIKALGVSGLAYKNGLPMPGQDTLDKGTVFHGATLEPDSLYRDACYYPGKVRRGAEWEAFKAQNQGKIILKQSDWESALAMAERVRAHNPARGLIERPGPVEVPIFWTDPDTGVECKCKPDKLITDFAVVELKSARSAHPSQFPRQVANLAYHAQAAFYCDAAGVDKHFFIVADETPGDVVVYRTPDDVLAEGRALYKGWLNLLKEYTAAKHFPGVAEDCFIDLTMPAWAYNETENENADSLGLSWE